MKSTLPNTECRLVELAELRESALNKRQHGDEAKLAELTESIRQVGVLTPLLVRPLGAQTFEIAAGHRRYRAAANAGLVNVPCLVRRMSDDEFLDILATENLQREDLHPLDEAEVFAELLKRPGYDAAGAGAKVGKTAHYVTRRLQLLHLAGPARQSFLRNDIPIGHALMLAQLEPALQEKGLEECWEPWTRHGGQPVLRSASELRFTLNRLLKARDLARAPFPLDVPLATGEGQDPLTCSSCPKAPGVNPLLIDDSGAQTCLDGACFERKVDAFIAEKSKAGLVAVSLDYSQAPSDVPAGVLPVREFVTVYGQQEAAEERDCEIIGASETAETGIDGPADAVDYEPDCGHIEQAIIAVGSGKGQAVRICRDRECPVHGRQLLAHAKHSEGSTAATRRYKRELEQRAQQEKARVQARAKILDRLLACNWEDAISVDLGKWVLKGLLGDRFYVGAEKLIRIAGRVGIHPGAKPLSTKKSEKAVDPAAFRMKILEQFVVMSRSDRARLVISALLDDHLKPPYSEDVADLLAAAAADCGFDLKKIEGEELRLLKNGGKPPAPAPKKKAAAKKAVRAAPKKTAAQPTKKLAKKKARKGG